MTDKELLIELLKQLDIEFLLKNNLNSTKNHVTIIDNYFESVDIEFNKEGKIVNRIKE